MKNKHKIFVFFTLFFVLVILTIFLRIFYTNYYILDIGKTTAEFKVVGPQNSGFNLDTDAIHLGTLPPGSTSEREAIIGNDYNFPIKIDIKSKGVGAKYIFVDENKFVIEPDEVRTVIFYAATTQDIEPGNYSADISIIYKRVLF